MADTFTLTATLTGTLVNGNGSFALSQTIPPNASFVQSFAGNVTTRTLNADTSSNSYVLVGIAAGTYSFTGLPSGFTPLTVQLNYAGTWFPASDALVAAQVVASVNFDIATLKAITSVGGVLSPASPFIDTRYPGLGALSLNNNGYGIKVVQTKNPGDAPTLTITALNITGTYKIATNSFGWSLPVTTAKAGDKVTINGPSKLGSVTSLHVKYTDSNGVLHDNVVLAQDFISQSDTQIVFYFPLFGNFTGTVYLFANGLDSDIPFPNIPLNRISGGTQFSGSVLVGTLTVTFADASGMYVLIPNKTSDTIYDRTTSGATKDVNILDPFIKTGFIP